MGDIDPSHAGNELLTVVDDDNSSSENEGDEIATFDASGQKLNSYTAGSGIGYSLALADIYPNRGGLEIAFGIEGTSTIGVVDGQLTELWTADIPAAGDNPAGQVGVADIDGDGRPEILANTGEDSAAGFVAYSPEGSTWGRSRVMGGISTRAKT